MKHFIILVTLVLSSVYVFAQDTDLKENFDKIGDDDAAMLVFFKDNDSPEYYNRFESACHQRNVGRSLLGAGIGLSIGGIAVAVVGLFNTPTDHTISQRKICLLDATSPVTR